MENTIFFNRADLHIVSLGLDLSRKGQSLLGLPRALHRLRDIVAKLKPDLVQGWLYYGNLLASAAAARSKAPVIWSIHGTTLPSWSAKPILRTVDRLSAASSHLSPTAVVYCAQSAQALHESRGYRTRISTVIPNGVDAAQFRPDMGHRIATRSRLGLSERDVAVGLFARFDAQKDIPTCLRAFARFAATHRRARLIVGGSRMDETNLDLCRLIEAEGVAGKVVLLGAIERIEQVIAGMDVVMLGSNYGEAMPMVLLEALISEVPIAATRIGNVDELPVPGYALVPPGDPELLAGALARVVGDAPGAWDMVFARIREEYGIDRCVAAYHELYRRLVRERVPA